MAGSDFEEKLKVLTQQRDKAVAAATEPIQLKYMIELEKLMKKATKDGDLEAAIKIRDKIAAEKDRGKPKNATELKEYLARKTWNIRNKKPDAKIAYTITFNDDGTFKHSGGRTGKVTFSGARTFKLWNYDPATLDDDLKGFRAKGSAGIYFGQLKE